MNHDEDKNFPWDDGFYAEIEEEHYVPPYTYPIGFAEEPLWDHDEEEDYEDYEDEGLYYADDL